MLVLAQRKEKSMSQSMGRMGFFFWQLWWLMPVFKSLWRYSFNLQKIILEEREASFQSIKLLGQSNWDYALKNINRKIDPTLCISSINNLCGQFMLPLNSVSKCSLIVEVGQEYWHIIQWLIIFSCKISFIRRISEVLAENNSEENYSLKSNLSDS